MSKPPRYIVKVCNKQEIHWLGTYPGYERLVLRTFKSDAQPVSLFLAQEAKQRYEKVGFEVQIIEMGIRGLVK